MIQWTQETLDSLVTAVNNKATLESPIFTGTVGGITATMVGLGNVTNESKATMFTSPTFTGTAVLPSATSIGTVSNTEIGYLEGVTSAIQTQLGTKAPLASPTFTGTVGGITSSMVGLGSVNNTSDADKPVSTATQTALNLKANLSSPNLTGTPTAPTANAGTNTTQIATTANVYNSVIGFGQTWQDVTSSRSLGTTYTNTTGKPITVTAYCGAITNNLNFVYLYINGILTHTTCNQGYQGAVSGVIGIVPNGSTYRVDNGGNSYSGWKELR